MLSSRNIVVLLSLLFCSQVSALRPSVRPEPEFANSTCTSNSTCVKGCSCQMLPMSRGGGTCVNYELGIKEINKCTKCKVHEDCKAKGDSCDITDGYCEQCVAAASKASSDACYCISTQWLKARNLLHARIRPTAIAITIAPVLCIPGIGGLPCGTPGHLLRDQSGKLVSYRQVCATRSDCIESVMEVSQLSHSYDWSPHNFGNFRLTSLSAHPLSSTTSLFSASRIIAHVTDLLNRAGLGFISNFIALLPSSVAATMREFQSPLLS